MNRAIKYRLYSNKQQEELFAKTFGCCRKIWNLMLADKIKTWEEDGAILSTSPASYKNKYTYLREVDSLALANVQLNLQSAYKACFDSKRKKKNGFPKYKSAKHSRKSYTTNNQKGTITLYSNSIKLPKIGKVKAKIYRKPREDWILKSATISQDKDNKYYASVLFQYDCDINKVKSYNNIIGLDYKSDGLYMDSDGNIGGSPKYYKQSQNKLAKLQRKLSKKKIGSKNRDKARLKVARLQKHISNQRLDYLHKKSTEITNLYDVICVESLDMKNIANKGFGNGKATLDNGYGMFINMLTYKQEDRGHYLIKVDKWFPSSQLCCRCGKQHKLFLSERVYKCDCGNIIDRDWNAAINIKQEGIRILQSA